jgi:hypothetical protein
MMRVNLLALPTNPEKRRIIPNPRARANPNPYNFIDILVKK